MSEYLFELRLQLEGEPPTDQELQLLLREALRDFCAVHRHVDAYVAQRYLGIGEAFCQRKADDVRRRLRWANAALSVSKPCREQPSPHEEGGIWWLVSTSERLGPYPTKAKALAELEKW